MTANSTRRFGLSFLRKLIEKILPGKCFPALMWIVNLSFNSKKQLEYYFFRRRALMHLKKRGYLISKVPPMSVPYKESEFEELDRKILDKINFLQFNSSAEDSKFLITGPASGSGVGSALSILCRGLKLGYLYNRTLLYDDRNLFYDFCFEPIKIHSLEKMDLKTEEQAHFNFLPQKEKVVWFEPWNSMEKTLEAETALLLKLTLSSGINYAAPLNHLPYNDIYVSGLLINSFLKLKEEYKEHIENKKREMGFKTPIIGLHIRQGDLFSTKNLTRSYRFHPIKVFFEAIEQVVSETGIKTVFVTSDSKKAIQQLPKNSGITFIYDDQEKRYDNCNVNMVREKPELKKQETMTAIKNIYLLGDCNYIVGTSCHSFEYSMALSYHRNKKLNGILIRRKGSTGHALEYLVTDDDKLTASGPPIGAYLQPLKARGAPWVH